MSEIHPAKLEWLETFGRIFAELLVAQRDLKGAERKREVARLNAMMEKHCLNPPRTGGEPDVSLN